MIGFKKFVSLCFVFFGAVALWANESEIDQKDPLVIAHHAASATSGSAQALVGYLVNSVYYATLWSSSFTPVKTGTVRLVNQQWSYEAMPSDKLVLDLGEIIYEFVVHEVQGTNYSGPNDFLLGNFSLRFGAKQRNTQTSLELVAMKTGNIIRGSVKGKSDYQGTLFDLDVDLIRNTFFENDSTGAHTKITESATGNIGFNDCKLSLNETAFFEMVTSRGSGAKSAQVDNKTRNSVLTKGSDVYVWTNSFVQKNYKNGKPSDPSAWVARGVVTKNNQPFGQYQLDATHIGSGGGFIHVTLQVQGKQRVLESWAAY